MIGSDIILFENLPSTNTYAANLLRTEAVRDGTVIRALFQSSGRGQMGNGWESEAGKNLLISIILYPNMVPASDNFLISMTISLGISDYLDRKISGCTIKWPNDIYIHNDKIAGILIENSVIDNSVISSIAGIGLNINQCRFLSNAPNPVSMSMITGKEYDIDLCLKELTDDLDNRYEQLKSGRNEIIRNDYIKRLFRLNVWSHFRDSDGIYKGRLVSVNRQGMLQVETSGGKTREYSFKEVEFIN